MPTRRGWAALGAGVALAVLWLVFGERLLLAGATFLVAAVGVGILSVRRLDPRAAVERTVVPRQIHDGDRAIVTLELIAARRLYRPAISDEVASLGTARFTAHRLDARTPMVARYEISCRPRGIYRVGPAHVSVRDPLGLAEAGTTVGDPARLVVFPRVDDLEGVPPAHGQDPTTNAAKASFGRTGGEDFFTLREYRHGDDLRRVHWPSSAKRDELMIKQLEVPWRSRALIVLDPRRDRYPDPSSFEHAVRGAASVLHHLYRAGNAPRLWAGDPGTGTPVGSASAFTAVMERLAGVRPVDALDLEAAVGRLRRGGVAGGLLVLVTGEADEADLGVYRSLGRDFSRMLVMSATVGGGAVLRRLERVGVLIVSAPPDRAWSDPWKHAVERSWSTVTAG